MFLFMLMFVHALFAQKHSDDGRNDARKDLASGHYVLFRYGLPVAWDSEFNQCLQGHGIEIRYGGDFLLTNVRLDWNYRITSPTKRQAPLPLGRNSDLTCSTDVAMQLATNGKPRIQNPNVNSCCEYASPRPFAFSASIHNMRSDRQSSQSYVRTMAPATIMVQQLEPLRRYYFREISTECGDGGIR